MTTELTLDIDDARALTMMKRGLDMWSKTEEAIGILGIMMEEEDKPGFLMVATNHVTPEWIEKTSEEHQNATLVAFASKCQGQSITQEQFNVKSKARVVDPKLRAEALTRMGMLQTVHVVIIKKKYRDIDKMIILEETDTGELLEAGIMDSSKVSQISQTFGEITPLDHWRFAYE